MIMNAIIAIGPEMMPKSPPPRAIGNAYDRHRGLFRFSPVFMSPPRETAYARDSAAQTARAGESASWWARLDRKQSPVVAQILVKLIIRPAVDLVCIDGYAIRPPSQPRSVVFAHEGRTADQQHSVEPDVSDAKVLDELRRTSVIVEREEPVDELTETVLETASPFGCRPASGPGEDAMRSGVFQLDGAVAVPLEIADHDVSRRASEDLELVRQAIRRTDIRKATSVESR